MKNITYLFGAGASAQAMPTVGELHTSLKVMYDYFTEILKLAPQKKSSLAAMGIMDSYGEEGLVKIKRLIEVIEALGRLVKSHASIDTLFKKIFLANADYLGVSIKHNGKAKFHKDELLSVYNFLLLFMEYSVYRDHDFYLNYKKYEQNEEGESIPNPAWLYMKSKIDIDLRYDAFLATILERDTNGGLRLPKNLKLVSWNYDIQLERALNGFILNSGREVVNSILKYCSEGVDNPSFFKLNGSSLIFDSKGSELNKLGNRIIESQFFDSPLIVAYLKSIELIENEIKPKFVSKIIFEWDSSSEYVRKNCLKSIRETDILIVIGYSFPTFNRLTDRKLYQSMSNLDRIYIQNQPDKTDEIVMSLKSLLSEKEFMQDNRIYRNVVGFDIKGDPVSNGNNRVLIETIPFTSQFFIPPEF